MAIKLVWGYAIVVLLGGMGMLMYAKWQDSGGWVGFAGWIVGLVVAVGFAMRRGMKRRAEMEAGQAARRD